jgi:hypothetical protein
MQKPTKIEIKIEAQLIRRSLTLAARPSPPFGERTFSSSSCVEIVITVADFVVTGGNFWAAACLLPGRSHQPNSQKKNFTDSRMMK